MNNFTIFTTDQIKETLGMKFPRLKYSLGACGLLIGKYLNYGLCVQHLHRVGYDVVRLYDQIPDDDGSIILVPLDVFNKGDLDPEEVI